MLHRERTMLFVSPLSCAGLQRRRGVVMTVTVTKNGEGDSRNLSETLISLHRYRGKCWGAARNVSERKPKSLRPRSSHGRTSRRGHASAKVPRLELLRLCLLGRV